MTRARVVAAGGVMLYVNGQPFGRVSDFKYSALTPRKEIHGIDLPTPFEIAATTTRISGSIQLYRTIGDAGAEGAGMATRLEDLTQEKYFTLALVEILSDTLIFQANYCSSAGQSWGAPARGMVTGSLDFIALDYSNELRPAKS